MIIDSPIVSGSYAGTGSLNQVGNVAISGSLTVTGSIVGNLTGTASYATTASYALNTTSASYAATASYAANVPETSSYAINALSASYAANATSASYAANSTSASYAATASYAVAAISASYAQTASYATNIVISGSIANVDYIDFDLTASFASALGRLGYDSGEGTLQFGLAGGNVTLNIGEDLYQYVYNAETSSMTKGQVVYVSGSQGNRIAVRLADNSADRGSASTLGFVAETITAGGQGWVMTEGNLRKLDTTGLIGGKLLFLGSTPGTYTQTVPTAPSHSVRLGYAERIDNNVGSIFVKIDNGYEIGELHDVVDSTTTSSYGDLFVKSGKVWINSKQLTGSYGVTGSITATSLSATSLTASNALITNNLAVNGTASFNYVQTITGSAVIIGQEYIILNTQTPASRYAGIKVYDSGSNSTSSIVWDSLTDHWVYENASGSTYSGGGFLAGPKNTGSLGDIIYPTQYRILRSQGDDHVYDSNIIDNDTAVKIGINAEVTGSLIVTNGITGSLSGTATNATTASYILNAVSASYAASASNTLAAQTASFVANAQTASYVLNAVSASYASSSTNADTASFVTTAQTASFVQTAQTASFVQTAQTASYVENAQSASYWSGSITNALSASYALTASYSANVPVTSSYANNAASASYALTSSYSLAGGGFPYSGSAEITGSLLITNLSGTGSRYLVTDASGNITAQSASAAIKITQAYTATAGQTTFAVTNGYSTGYVDVFINGSKLNATEFTDTSGTNIVLATGSFANDIVEVVKYLPASGVSNNVLRQQTTFTASAGQTVFSASYTPGLLDIFYNGSKLAPDDFTANNGTFFTLATASAANDIIDVFVYSYQVGAFSGIGGVGTASQIAYFNTSNSITGSPNFTISGSTMTVTGSLIVSGSGTFTNIGPAVFSGSLTSTQGFTGSFSGTASFAQTASFVTLAQTASFVTLAQTASFVANAQTASSADAFTVRNTLTAQTLVVQTITSSVVYSSGSNIFGNSLANTQALTGSVSVTGSLAVVTNGTEFQVGATGVTLGNALTDIHNVTGSLRITGSLTSNGVFSGSSAAFSGNISSLQNLVLTRANTSAGNNIEWRTASTLNWYIGTRGLVNNNFYIVNEGLSANNLILDATTGAATFSSTVDGTIFNSTSNAFRFSGNNAISLASLNAQNVVKINAAGYWGTQLVGANDSGILINNVGNVGIGTTGPDAGLTVETSFTAFNALAVRSSNAFSTTPETAIAFRTKFNTAGAYSTNGIIIGYKDNATDGNQQGGLQFWTNAGSGVAEKMRITSGGFVGIGTTSPSRLFHIHTLSTPNNVYNGQFQIGGNLNTTNDNYLSIGVHTTGEYTFMQAAKANVGGIPIALQVGGGNVGIGVTNPEVSFVVKGTSIGSGGKASFYGGGDENNWSAVNNEAIRIGRADILNAFYSSIWSASGSGGNELQHWLRFYISNGSNTQTLALTMFGNGNVSVAGALSKGSGSFRIKHPLLSKRNTHELVHSFIEGPQADLIYRGKIRLVAGRATVNIDEAATMTEGTFEALCREVQCFTSNETSWDAVRGKVEGNILTIECQNTESTDEISWLVIGERQDEHMMDTNWTDSNGKVIVEPLILEEETTI